MAGRIVHMKFLQKDGRRAVIHIRGRLYAACLVDLPCIIEGMKSWDKRGWWKSADICQMLLVLGRVQNDAEAMIHPLPKEVETSTWQFAHGLTPPMHWVRKRRFRKRVSNKTIEAVEDEVNRLLENDKLCHEYVKHEIIDTARETREETDEEEPDGQVATGSGNLLDDAGLEEEEYEDEDAEGEDEDVAYVNGNGELQEMEVDDADQADELQMMLEQAMAEGEGADLDSEAPSFLDGHAGEIGIGESSATGTPAGNAESADDTSDDDEGDDEGEEVDEDFQEQQQAIAQQREEIADLETAVKNQTVELEKQSNAILRQKVMKKIQSLKADLQLKKEAIGEGED